MFSEHNTYIWSEKYAELSASKGELLITFNQMTISTIKKDADAGGSSSTTTNV